MKTNSSNAARSLAILSFVAFIALGMPDGLLGVAWPSIRADFGQPLDSLGMLLFGATVGYLVASFSNGWLMARLGVGKLLGGSALLTGIALAGYTVAPAWPFMIPFALFAGLGAGGIDASLNAWVEAHLSPRVMQWLHASFGIGITAGPLIMTAGLARTGSWHPGYWVVAAIQLALGLVFLARAAVWDNAPKAPHYEAETADGTTAASFSETLRNPVAWASASLFFVYVGIELGMGHWAYTWLSTELALSATFAGVWTASYWASFTVGRIVAGVVAHRFTPATILRAAFVSVVVVTFLLAAVPVREVKIAGILLLGLVIAPIFPSMVSTTSLRVGREHAASTIGMQMAMAGLGVGVVPGLMGVVARNFGVNLIPWMIAACAVVLTLIALAFPRMRAKGA